jgi:hypothetical protein
MTCRRTLPPSAMYAIHEITREQLVKADHFRSIDCYVDYFGDSPAPRRRHSDRAGSLSPTGSGA